MSTRNEPKPVAADQPVDASRRTILTGSSILAAAGLLWKPQEAPAARRQGGLVLDVACLGPTFAPDFTGALDQPNFDFRGASFYVEGYLYPGGTITPGVVFDPMSVEPMGHWFCRGWFMSFAARPEPGVITSQEYTFQTITAEASAPPDTLSSQGVENGGPGLPAPRSVIGGTGRFRGAAGEVVQETIGENTTLLNVFNFNAPTFRFHFELNRGNS